MEVGSLLRNYVGVELSAEGISFKFGLSHSKNNFPSIVSLFKKNLYHRETFFVSHIN